MSKCYFKVCRKCNAELVYRESSIEKDTLGYEVIKCPRCNELNYEPRKIPLSKYIRTLLLFIFGILAFISIVLILLVIIK